MKKHTMLFAIVLLTAAGVLTALLLGGCGRQKPADSTPTQMQNATVSDTAEALVGTGETADPTTAAEEETGEETTGQTKPGAGSSQNDSQQSTKPQGSGGVENWSSDGTVATGSSQTTESTQPEETEVQTTTPTPSQSTQPDKELTDLTFAQYLSLSEEDQEKFFKAFESEDAYLAWHKAAKAIYDREQKEGIVSGSTDIDISDYIGK